MRPFEVFGNYYTVISMEKIFKSNESVKKAPGEMEAFSESLCGVCR